MLKPRLQLIGAEHASEAERVSARERLEYWLARAVAGDLRPLAALETAWAEGRLPADARGLAFRLIENAGALEATPEDLHHVSASARQALHKIGVRIGRHSIFMPQLIRPRAAQTLAILRHALHPGQGLFLPRPGALSVGLERAMHWGECAAAGYRVCGRAAVRFDIVEKLAEAVALDEQPADQALARLVGLPMRQFGGLMTALGYHRRQSDGGAVGRWEAKATRAKATRPSRRGASAFAALAELIPSEAPKPRLRRKRA